MDWASIIGRLGSGFSVKAAVIAAALYTAHEVYAYVAPVLEQVSKGLGQ